MACLLLTLLPAGMMAARASRQAPRLSSGQADAIDAPRITQQAFKKLVAANNVVVVDTRVIDAFEQSRMRGALPLPLEGRLTWPDAYEKTVAVLLKTRKPVVVYCA
jgi:hypothetical protein